MRRTISLSTAFATAVAAVYIKVLLSILWEYRWYFPPDFDQGAFLIGRRHSFHGLYSIAFYVHIVSSPIALVLGTFQALSGGNPKLVRLHRHLGPLQASLTLLVAVSGIVMAREAFSGRLAGWGFYGLSVLTALSVLLATYHACCGQWLAHRLWAGRCFVLLCSPLLLRVVGGILVVTQWESDWSYRWNAWLSWIVPLLIHQWWWYRTDNTCRAASAAPTLRQPSYIRTCRLIQGSTVPNTSE